MDHCTPLLLDANRVYGFQPLLCRPLLAGVAGSMQDLAVDIRVERTVAGNLTVQAVVTNRGRSAAVIRCLRWRSPCDERGAHSLRFPVGWRPHVAHTENFRGDYLYSGSTRGTRYLEPLTNQHVEFGWSEDQVFPGLAVVAEGAAVVAAAASQDRFHIIWRLRGGNGDDQWIFEFDELPSGLDSLRLEPGASLAGERIYLGIADTSEPQAAMADFFASLRSDGRIWARGMDNPLPTQRIWCSWNYDFFADIDQTKILAQTPVLRRCFPSVRFLQLDDGYQALLPNGQRQMIDFLWNGSPGHDPDRFPDGLAGFSAKVKEAGFRPAIWMGLWAHRLSPMIQAHPEWILLDDQEREVGFPGFGPYGHVVVLDPSVPGVRDYLDHVFATVFGSWGFEGVKLDFSSFAFENKRLRYRHPGATALEHRRWLAQAVRRHLPADGFFGWCVVCGTGNPHLAPEADYFRCAEDINHASWETVRRVAGWCANTCMLLRQHAAIPNIDSIGWKEISADNEWRAWLCLAAVTGWALEISGDLRRCPEERLSSLARTLELSDPRAQLTILDLTRGSADPPTAWLSDRRADGALLALFNWSDHTRVVLPPPLPRSFATAVDAFTGEASQHPSRGLLLQPHAGRLILLR